MKSKRKCRICKTKKSLGDFPSHRGSTYNKGYVCKECNTEVCGRSRLRKLYRQDPDKAKEYIEKVYNRFEYLLDEFIKLQSKE